MRPAPAPEVYPARFPGKLAGASLKPTALDANSLASTGFPGKLAGASLKQRRCRREPVGGRLFPRQTCRGLIEAVAGRPPMSDVGNVSPANLPGPH